jgi:serine/threonine protein kinase
MASELSPVPDDLGFEPTIRGLETRQRVFGRYQLRRILGRGGMGIVWLAQDERLEREVALKFLPDAINFDPAALDDLKRETRRCLELTHPSITRIYDFVQDEQAAAISMEYIDGQTLATLRIEQASRVFEVGDLRNWMIRACQALHYAHEEVGVVHRDIKPANFMITSRGQVKVADFGIAQSVCDSMTRLTMQRSSSGTLAYMSPQQLNGEMAKPSDDIYALGATIYELLTGKPPFHSGDVSFQVRLSVPRRMAERRQELEVAGDPIPDGWEDAIAACLAKIPEERPATMGELAERLRLASPTRRLPAIGARPAGAAPKISARPAEPAPDTAQATQKRSDPPTLSHVPPEKKRWQISAAIGIVATIIVAIAALRGHPVQTAPIVVPQPASDVATLEPLDVPKPAVAETLRPAQDLPPVVPAKPPAAALPAEIRVESDPAGALVRIAGQPDQHTPAIFTSLPAGTYQVVLTQDGYQAHQQSVTAIAGAKLDLGSIVLAPLTGNLTLNTLPGHVHYMLAGIDRTKATHEEGTTPEYFAALPAGNYQLTLSLTNFPTYSGTVFVQDHTTKVLAADLIELSFSANATANTAKVIRGEMDAAQLNPQEHAELIDLEQRAFTAYLNGNLLACAHGELQQLKALGADTTQQDTELATRQLTDETQIASQLRTLIHQKKWASACQLFSTLNASFEKDSMDRLNAEFQAPLAQYQQQIDSAIAQGKTAPPEVGYLQIKTLIGQYPLDLNLHLALAAIAEQAAPDHARLTDLLQVFHTFAKVDKDDACQPIFAETQAAVADEMQQLDAVTTALAAAKQGTPDQRHQLAELQERKDIYENRRIGSPDKNNPFSAAVNFFGKAVTGHAVVNNHPYFESRHEKHEAIDDVESQITTLKASMVQPPEVIDQAQKNYDAFAAKVPWGQ